MLRVTIPCTELFNEQTREFSVVKEQTIQLEHSLVSLSKWESKWHKPFLTKDNKTIEETVDYIRCMTTSQNVDPNVYLCITDEILDQVSAYIEDSMTATWFSEGKNKSINKEIITAEIIYYWMISLNIPFECQKWHLNKLLTLIRVCNIKNSPPKKMSKADLLSKNRALNKARRQAHNSRG